MNPQGPEPERCSWFLAEIDTEGGRFTGRLCLDAARPILDQIMSTTDASLRLWAAHPEGQTQFERALDLRRESVRSIEILARVPADAGKD